MNYIFYCAETSFLITVLSSSLFITKLSFLQSYHRSTRPWLSFPSSHLYRSWFNMVFINLILDNPWFKMLKFLLVFDQWIKFPNRITWLFLWVLTMIWIHSLVLYLRGWLNWLSGCVKFEIHHAELFWIITSFDFNLIILNTRRICSFV